ncbi:hypothetical protein CARUB_v100131681mg, partial [Capsella rubella]
MCKFGKHNLLIYLFSTLTKNHALTEARVVRDS